MSADRERAERIAKKHQLNASSYLNPVIVAAMLEMAAEVRRETVEECAQICEGQIINEGWYDGYHSDHVNGSLLDAAKAILALLPAATKETEPK